MKQITNIAANAADSISGTSIKHLIATISVASALCVFPSLAQANPIDGFAQTNLVSDIPGLATFTDANLKNPWGITASATSPYWISDNHTGVSTLYNGLGVASPTVFTIPSATLGGTGSPTGTVRNAATTGPGAQFTGHSFIFATEDGLIVGRLGGATTGDILVNNHAAGAIYKGLALGTVGANSYLYAANFHSGAIDVIKGTGGAPALTGSFANPTLPAGYSPFNIQQIGGKLYVAYALRDAVTEDEIAGAGLGYVAVFDLQGNLLQNLISAGGALDAPWGLAIAPHGFRNLGGDLLVGNFGDGTINAFDVVTGAYLGTLSGNTSAPLANDGLWALTFGNGNTGSDPLSLYLTAGLNDEADGLFARIRFVPEPGTIAFFGSGLLGLGFARRKPKRA